MRGWIAAFFVVTLWTACAVAGSPPAPRATPVPAYLQAGINPPSHLRQAIAKAAAGGTVNVCIAGDSTSLMTPAGVNPTEGLWYHLQRQFLGQNPGVTFSFLNYGIPGTVFSQYLNTSAYAAAQAYGLTWYASSGATWTQYVAAASCDILFLNWGVNDAYNVNPDNLYTFLNGIGGYTTHPGIVFITNAVANRAAGLPYSNATYQAGYLATPSLIRAVAELGASGFTTGMSNPVPPVGLIDIGRWFQQAVLGVDYTTQRSVNVLSTLPGSVVVNTATPYVFPQTDGDFYLKMVFTGQRAAFDNTTTVNVTVGAMDGGTGTQTAAVVYTTGGAYLQFNNGSRIQVSSLQTFSGADATIEISVNQNHLTLTANGKTLTRKVIKASAPFTPKLSIAGGSAPATITATLQAYSVGRAQRYNRTMTSTEAYGPAVASAQVSQATTAGNNVLTFSAGVPAAVAVGIAVADVDAPTAIPSGTTVSAFTSTTVTLSANVAAPGVGSTDNISFGTTPGTSGGNGINHAASLGLNYIYGSVIRATNLCLTCYTPNGSAAKSWDTQVPTTGATITTTYGLRELTVNPAADLAALTVVIPPTPADRDEFTFVSTKNITTLTINGGTTGVTANTRLVWRYNTSLTAWVRWQ